MDSCVKHLQVTTQSRFDPRGNPFPIVQYSYFLDGNGPFMDEFKQGEDTLDAVTAKIQGNIDKLRAVGALPPASDY